MKWNNPDVQESFDKLMGSIGIQNENTEDEYQFGAFDCMGFSSPSVCVTCDTQACCSGHVEKTPMLSDTLCSVSKVHAPDALTFFETLHFVEMHAFHAGCVSDKEVESLFALGQECGLSNYQTFVSISELLLIAEEVG